MKQYRVGNDKTLTRFLSILFQHFALFSKYLSIDLKYLISFHSRFSSHPSKKNNNISIFKGHMINIITKDANGLNILITTIIKFFSKYFKLSCLRL